MTDSDKGSGNQRNPWSPEDWRMLIITFVGGLASILVGAGMLGLAVVLARHVSARNDIFTWVFGVAPPVVGVAYLASYVRVKKKDRWDLLLIWLLVTGVVFYALTWIGVAAGIK